MEANIKVLDNDFATNLPHVGAFAHKFAYRIYQRKLSTKYVRAYSMGLQHVWKQIKRLCERLNSLHACETLNLQLDFLPKPC